MSPMLLMNLSIRFIILQYIDLVIASAEEGVSKPDKKIFDIALSRANW